MHYDLFAMLLITASILFETVVLKVCVAKLGSHNIADKKNVLSNSVENKLYLHTRTIVRDK
jgi:hypothetical protein